MNKIPKSWDGHKMYVTERTKGINNWLKYEEYENMIALTELSHVTARLEKPAHAM